LSTTNLAETADFLNNGTSTANGIQSATGSGSRGPEIAKLKEDETPLSRNAAALKYLTQGMPNVLAPFFQGLLC
jgi:E3 ubiquitin-protein ligase HUWE1